MEKNELDKYNNDIIIKEAIENIKQINDKIQNICGEQNNIDQDEIKIKELKKIINYNIFDDLYLQIKNKFLTKYFDEKNYFVEKNNKNFNANFACIMQKEKLLLGYYFAKIFNFSKEEDVLYFEGDEVEKTIKDFNDELNKLKQEKHYVLY